MEGTFTSTALHAADPENFRDIHLVMTRIWKDRGDGAWLYIEQALADRLDRPYRQRVYKVTAREDGTFVSEVFTLPGAPIDYVGGRLGNLLPERLVARAGCAVLLKRTADGYVGGTAGKDCPSELKNATYATSEVVVRADGMTSWDRGYDDAGTQVWGAKTGPYQFIKEE